MMDDFPWTDCKVAFEVDNENALWEAIEYGNLTFPEGWELTDTDCYGTEGELAIAIFRVETLLTLEDGLIVQKMLQELV